MDVQERALSEIEKAEHVDYTRRAMINLGLSKQKATPEQIVDRVQKFVDDWQEARANTAKPLLDDHPPVNDVSIGLGCVWGNQVVSRFGWEWICLLANGKEHFAVAAPDRSAVIYPFYFMKYCLNDAELDCTAALSFNMMSAGKAPQIPPKKYANMMLYIRRIVPTRPKFFAPPELNIG